MALSNVTQKPSKSPRKAVMLTARVPDARTVSVSGDFSGWSDEGIKMSRETGNLWEVELHLPPGQYQYRLRVDGHWQDHAEAKNRVPNAFGSENCVLTVS